MTDIAHAPHATKGPPPGVPQAPFGPRLFTGVMGVLVAAIMAGLNNRVGALALVDIRGVHGYGVDDGHWLSIVYTAGELVAMPITSWFAGTFSFRRYHIAVVAAFLLVGMLLPFAPNYGWMLALRAVQGLLGGALIPLLMGAALRFFPTSVRLYGLSLYALTATFAPNVAIWLAAVWTDQLFDWRLVYWQTLPLAGFSMWAVCWGIPQDPIRLERFRLFDSLGFVTGIASLTMLVIALEQGERLDWFHSPLVVWLLFGGLALFVVFLVSEWYHHLPFVKLQLLERRNLWLAFIIFVGMLVVLLSGSLLPADQLAHVQGFRPLQLAPIGLAIALPQFILGPLAAFLLYQKWVDARRMMALGLLLLAIACFMGASVTSEGMVAEFWAMQALQAVGQPLAVISLLFIATSAVVPMEGPFVSGIVNALRVIGTFLGSIGIGSFLIHRTAAHERGLVDRLGRIGFDPGTGVGDLAARIGHQAFTLSIADSYRMLGVLALLLIPLTFFLFYTPPPVVTPPRFQRSMTMTMPKLARLGAGGLIALVALGSVWAWAHDEGAGESQTTDDAHVQADYSTVAPKVAGLVAQVMVEDNEQVRRGQLLAVIDDRDFRVAVTAAEAELKSAQARADGLRAALARQASVVAQAKAAVDADSAAIALSRANARRYQDLASDGSASVQERQESLSRLQSDEAAHRRDSAAHAATQQQRPMLAADVAEAAAAVEQARAALDAARLALSYTRIVAPVDGMVGRRSVRVGNYVQVGTPLLAVVPLREAYVEANFRETQMRRIRPGQRATIRIDTLPDIELKGHVESIAPASGVTFAAIAPENATGNFTKIVQRLSTRIVIDPGQRDAAGLRVGMSVVPTVLTVG